ncbi:TolC family outer membrane protein [Zavarzinia compransoris]|uniref:TolC family outer membrane protein n=1 Tax=Zavarzinia marina TaxID=2911065 RepID=UPI001F1D67D3|nr:TolC family outer membrane protein [Zavarzinia marina]MCF4164736.1 TolC family outer membrane protein [Zavarzinia marina]
MSLRRPRHPLRALATVVALVMTSAAVRAETLTEALVSAYQTNPTLAAARANLRVTDETLAQALALFRPSVLLTATGGIATLNTQSTPGADTTPISSNAQIVLPLFPLSGFAALETADARIAESRATLAATEQQVLLAVVEVYLNVRRDMELVAVTAAIESLLAKELTDSRIRLREGDLSETDIALVEARLAQVQADGVLARQNLRRSHAAYVAVVGHPAIDLQPTPAPPSLPQTLDAAERAAMAANPQVLRAKSAEAVANAAIGDAEAGLYPALDLVAGGRRDEDTSFEGSELEQYSLQLQLRVPLYEGGGTRSRIRQARELLNQRRAETMIAERDIMRQVAEAFDAMTATRDAAIYTAASVTAADKALSGVKQEALLGYRTTIDLLQAEQNFLEAQRRSVVAARDERFAGWRLLATVGGFTPRETALPVTPYDGKAHAEAVRDAYLSTDPIPSPEVMPVPTSTAPPPVPTVPDPAPADARADADILEDIFDLGGDDLDVDYDYPD